jgi:hypothetical protein
MPRRVPMEVHKTADRGWAVRATVNIQRGEVVGIFMGLVSFLLLRPTLTVVLFVRELVYVWDCLSYQLL